MGFLRWSWVEAQLRARRSIWLSSTRPDGRPHCVPVWFVWLDGAVWFTTPADTQKVVNLRGQPWTVLSLGDGDDVIVLEGPALPVTEDAVVVRVEAAYGEKYVDPPTGVQATVGDGPVFRVAPGHVMAWVYGDISGRTDWRFPTARR